MLSGDEDVVDSDWLDLNSFSGIFNNDLGFAVRSQPRYLSRVSCISHLFADLVSKVVRVRVEDGLVPFVSGISEHESLVTSSEVIFGLVLMDSRSNFLGLSLNVDDDGHALVVNTLVLVVISDILDNISGDLFVLNSFSLDGSLSK